MSFYTQRVQTPALMKQKRTQCREDFLALPNGEFLAQHKVSKLQSITLTMSKEKVRQRIEQSVCVRAARDRHARTVKRIKTKLWTEIQHQPRAPVDQCASQMPIPQIVVTTPDGEMRWLEDPNKYEYVLYI